MAEKEIGFVEHWFGHLMVAGIKITDGPLKVGDKVRIKGHTSDFICSIDTMEMEHGHIDVANNGDDIGVKVPEHARDNDKVYLVTEE